MKLRELRKAKGLTIPMLSNLSGVKIRTIEEVERRDRCTMVTAKKLAKALEVSLDTLCYNDDEKEKIVQDPDSAQYQEKEQNQKKD